MCRPPAQIVTMWEKKICLQRLDWGQGYVHAVNIQNFIIKIYVSTQINVLNFCRNLMGLIDHPPSHSVNAPVFTLKTTLRN